MNRNKPSNIIYLQWYREGDGEPEDASDVTWCKDKIFDDDIEYVKAEIAKEANKKRVK